MDATVGGKLGVKGGGHQRALPHQNGKTLAAGQDFDAGPGFDDPGRADEDHLQRATGQLGWCDEDGRVDLAAVGVALHDGIERREAALGGIADFAGQQDGSSTGAEDGLGGAEVLQSFKEIVLVEEAEDGGGFAAGEDQAIDGGELVWLADFDGLGAGFGKGGGVGGVVALDGEDADLGDFSFRQRLS